MIEHVDVRPLACERELLLAEARELEEIAQDYLAATINARYESGGVWTATARENARLFVIAKLYLEETREAIADRTSSLTHECVCRVCRQLTGGIF